MLLLNINEFKIFEKLNIIYILTEKELQKLVYLTYKWFAKDLLNKLNIFYKIKKILRKLLKKKFFLILKYILLNSSKN